MTAAPSSTVAFPGPLVRRDIDMAVRAMEESIISAIAEAKRMGVPQGLICTMLRVHEQMQVDALIEGAE